MIVVVDNLGPVRHAEIDLGKRLIVFAGPNHSGKTHVAWTIYGLLQHIGIRRFESAPHVGSFGAAVLGAGADGLPVARWAEFEREHLKIVVADFVEALAQYFVAPRELFASVAVELHFDDRDLSALESGKTLTLAHGAKSFVFLSFDDNGDSVLRVELVPTDEFGEAGADEASLDGQRSTDGAVAAERLGQYVATFLHTWTQISIGGSQSAMFPAERTAVSLFSRELGSSRFDLVDEILRASGDPAKAMRIATRSARRYPGPILDCIKVANDLDSLVRRKSKFAFLAVELEEILGGRVDVSGEGEIGFALAEPGRPRVPFHVSASVVKSLASLVFYFRHQAQTGATLVIDEPELNLHPDLQRKVTRFLAKAVNAGFRIILSTHSDYVLREFSNLVRLGDAGERGVEVAQELGYDPASSLKPEVVGVWHFANGEAEALEITGDGFNLPSIEDAIMRQNMDTQHIELAVGD